jgi:hypothetical protein
VRCSAQGGGGTPLRPPAGERLGPEEDADKLRRLHRERVDGALERTAPLPVSPILRLRVESEEDVEVQRCRGCEGSGTAVTRGRLRRGSWPATCGLCLGVGLIKRVVVGRRMHLPAEPEPPQYGTGL